MAAITGLEKYGWFFTAKSNRTEGSQSNKFLLKSPFFGLLLRVLRLCGSFFS
jgi:hypothetical protein